MASLKGQQYLILRMNEDRVKGCSLKIDLRVFIQAFAAVTIKGCRMPEQFKAAFLLSFIAAEGTVERTVIDNLSTTEADQMGMWLTGKVIAGPG